MFKTLSFATLMAVSQAIEVDAEAFRALDDYSNWETSTAEFSKLLTATGGKFKDDKFPADASSYGTPEGDSANVGAGANSAAVTWKSLGDIYGSHTKLFAHQEVFSSAAQGQLGNCYLIATAVGFDARPGALEDLFVHKTVNSKGIYAVKFNIYGQTVYVHVDDRVPVK